MALSGIKVIELAGLAPGPFAGLVLADNGATVIRVDRPNSISTDILSRGKQSITLNLKTRSGHALLRKFIAASDVVIDPFRPGVMERLGLGPDVFLGPKGINPRLIYARIAGFPSQGPHKDMAGHDINYLALSGVLSMIHSNGKPTFPLNLLADFAGGGFACANGILLALFARHTTGKGQIVNTDMVSGTRYIASFPLLHKVAESPYFAGDAGSNVLDGGAPYYNVYQCQDGDWMSVGCLEPQFFKVFIERFMDNVPSPLDLADGWLPSSEARTDATQWPQFFTFLTNGFRTKPRDYWTRVFDKSDACVVPILSVKESGELAQQVSGTSIPTPHPVIISPGGPNPSSIAPPNILTPGEDNSAVLGLFGISPEEQRALASQGALGDGVKL